MQKSLQGLHDVTVTAEGTEAIDNLTKMIETWLKTALKKDGVRLRNVKSKKSKGTSKLTSKHT